MQGIKGVRGIRTIDIVNIILISVMWLAVIVGNVIIKKYSLVFQSCISSIRWGLHWESQFLQFFTNFIR